MPRWKTVAIYGVGLIGGSIGSAVRRRGLADQIVGIGRSADKLRRAVELGVIERATTDVADGVGDADMIVVCTPVQSIPEHVFQVAAHCPPGALITDAGSTKQRLVRDVARRSPQANFVGSHPLAGSDRSGVDFHDPDLFVDRAVVVTPTEATSHESTQETIEFWKALDARVYEMTPDEHDRAVAVTSHLPHVLASVMAAETPREHLFLVAGGWLDTTRVAAADVELWTQILSENSENVVAALARLRQRIDQFEASLTRDAREDLMRQLAAGKNVRDAVAN